MINTSRRAPTTSWPASLAGTDVDGAIALDANGRLVRSLGIRRLFDYWLTTLGEQDLAAIRQQIAAMATATGGPGVSTQVLALFDDYVAYLQSAESIVASSMEPTELLRVHEALYALRREYLGTWADAFFADEESALIEQITQIQIRQDPDLDPATRQYLLERWEETLSDGARHARLAATAHHEVIDHNRDMRHAEYTESEKRQEWAEVYGPEAAERLAAMEVSRTTFAQNRDAFLEAYREVMADPDLSAAQRDLAIDGMLAGYSDPERRRLLSLAQLPAGAIDP